MSIVQASLTQPCPALSYHRFVLHLTLPFSFSLKECRLTWFTRALWLSLQQDGTITLLESLSTPLFSLPLATPITHSLLPLHFALCIYVLLFDLTLINSLTIKSVSQTVFYSETLTRTRGKPGVEHQSETRKSPQSYYLVCHHPPHFMNTSIMKEK